MNDETVTLPHAGPVKIGDRVALWPVGTGHPERFGTVASLPGPSETALGGWQPNLGIILDRAPEHGPLRFGPGSVRRKLES